MTLAASLAFALAAFFAAYFGLVRIGKARAALAVTVLLWAAKLVGIWLVDLQPPTGG